MSTELNEAELALQAQILVNNPAYKAAVAKLREVYITAWTKTETDDIEARERIYNKLTALDEIVAEIEGLRTAHNVSSFNKALRDKRR